MERTILSLRHLTSLIDKLYFRLTSILYTVYSDSLAAINPRLVNLAITGASISLLIASIGQTLGTSRRLSLSVQRPSRPFAFSLQDSCALTSSSPSSYQVAWESSSLCRPSNRTLLAPIVFPSTFLSML